MIPILDEFLNTCRLLEKSGVVKILLVTRENDSERRYGVGRSLLPIQAELERRGHKTRYLCQADLGSRSRKYLRLLHVWLAVPCRWLPGKTNYYGLVWAIVERLSMGRLAAKVAAMERFTHVHCHDPIIAMGYRLFSFFRMGKGVCWGISQHGFGCYAQAIHDDGIKVGTRIMRWLRNRERKILLAADWVIAPTRSSLTQMARDLGVYPMPSGWDTVYHSRPQITLYEKQDARSRLAWDAQVVYVLGVGRLVPLKQFSLVIQACARLISDRQIRLVLAGEGECDALLACANESGLEEGSVSFVVADDIGLYLSATDLYVSASLSESFGIANLEAMLAGTPSVCSAVGGVPEVVGNGAVLVQPELAALTDAMQNLLDDVSFRERVAEKGRARGASWPDVAEITSHYEQIYRSALAKKNREI